MFKRGDVHGVWAVIGAVLALAIIAIFTYVIIVFSGIFRGVSPDEQASVNNFMALNSTISELIAQPGTFASKQMQFQIPNNFILVGFDKDWHGDLKDDTWFGLSRNTIKNGKTEASICHDEGIRKPDQCFEKACICLFKDTNGDDFMEDSSGHVLVAPCITFEQDLVFSAPADNNLNLENCEGETGTDDYDDDCPIDGARKYPQPSYGSLPGWREDFYEFLVIYGECGKEWGGPKTIYVEKYIDIDNPERINILVSIKTKEIEEREKNLKDITARKLLDNGKKALSSNQVDIALSNFKQVVDSYPNTAFANSAKAEIRGICSKDPKPSGCEGLDPRYLQ